MEIDHVSSYCSVSLSTITGLDWTGGLDWPNLTNYKPAPTKLLIREGAVLPEHEVTNIPFKSYLTTILEQHAQS